MFDYLVNKVHASVSLIADYRKTAVDYSLSDVLMSGFAMFSLKDPSLLSFVHNYEARKDNLERIYHIQNIPSEQGFRKILDPVKPDQLLDTFKYILSDTKVADLVHNHRCFVSLGGYCAIAVDGTDSYCSYTTKCPSCLVKKVKNGEQYYHKLAGACIVNPDKNTVFPVFGEPITQQDGTQKNDCEYNAFKRLVPKIEQILPNTRKLILLDGLFATGPAIRLMLFYSMDFITVIKDGYVLLQADRLIEQNALQNKTWYKNKYIKCTAQWINGLVLNGTHPDIDVNYLQYQEIDTRTGKMIYTAKWITSLALQDTIIEEFVKTARARWKIENETFNVLKNHGYNFEHNYGHGKAFLSSVLALIMLLAFLIDQLTQTIDESFQKALKTAKTLRDLRQKVRVIFDIIPCLSMNVIYKIIARELKIGFST